MTMNQLRPKRLFHPTVQKGICVPTPKLQNTDFFSQLKLISTQSDICGEEEGLAVPSFKEKRAQIVALLTFLELL